ncbi:hypothetical protein LBMAG53_14720 [Planctomycetota bacterium]|nr:hypothetical protein LBMAG53_14720 [Planctomycetota bacterium]
MRLTGGERTALIYGLAGIIGKSAGLAIIPLLALFLSLDEVGRWAELTVLRILSAAVGTACLDAWLTQRFHKQEDSVRQAFAAGCVLLAWRWSLIVALPGVLIAGLAAADLIAAHWLLWGLVGAASALGGASTVGLSLLRITEKPKIFAVLNGLVGAVSVALCWGTVAAAGWGLWGVAAGTLLPWVGASVWFAWTCRGGQASWTDASGFTWRTMPSRLLSEVSTQVDRLVLGIFVSDRALGLYDLALRTAGAVGMVQGSLKNTLMPTCLRRLAEGKPIAATLRQGGLALLAAGFAVVAGGVVLAQLRPEWRESAVFLPGAVAVQCWWFAGAANGIASYHAGLVRLQAFLPLVTLPLITAGMAVGLASGGIWGGQWLLVAGTAAGVLVTERAIRRSRPDLPGNAWLFLEMGIASALLLGLSLLPWWAGCGAALVSSAIAGGWYVLRRR